MVKIVVPAGYRLIFRASRMQDGEKIYAKTYGLRGFPILIPIR